jgi:hypothetical protein
MASALEATSLENSSINYQLMQTIRDFVSVELANGVMNTFKPIKSFVKFVINMKPKLKD